MAGDELNLRKQSTENLFLLKAHSAQLFPIIADFPGGNFSLLPIWFHTSLYKNSQCEMSRFVTISGDTRMIGLYRLGPVTLHRVWLHVEYTGCKKNRVYINFISYVSRINDVYVLYWSSISIFSQRLFIVNRRSIVSIVCDLYLFACCCHNIPSQFDRLYFWDL